MNLAVAKREDLLTLIQAQDSMLQAQKVELQTQNSEIESLKGEVEWYRKQYFGAKSERYFSPESRQLNLLDVPKKPPAKGTTVAAYERKNRAKPTEVESDTGLRFDESVPVEENVVLPKEVEGLSEDEYEIIGQKVTERLKQIPAQYQVVRTIRPTVKIKQSSEIKTAPAPEAVIKRSFADASLLAGLLTDKFCFHLPLHRQHQRMAMAGVHISRPHLTKLTRRSLELLEPVYHAISSMVFTSEVISVDETTVKAVRAEGKMKDGYFWVAHADEQVVFMFSASRGKSVIQDEIKENCRVLLSDGHSAYNSFVKDRSRIVHAQCWAHARRKFFDAKSNEELELINQLFANEKAKGELLLNRRLKSLPLVDQLFKRLKSKAYEEQIEMDTAYGKAIRYCLNREEGLRAYLSDPDIPISNNHVERQIRPVAIGRKNWMFCWTTMGARYSAVAYTLINNCRMHGIDPYKYLTDVFNRISTHPVRQVDQLVPKNWKNLEN